jgi:hypothetical protein
MVIRVDPVEVLFPCSMPQMAMESMIDRTTRQGIVRMNELLLIHVDDRDANWVPPNSQPCAFNAQDPLRISVYGYYNQHADFICGSVIQTKS